MLKRTIFIGNPAKLSIRNEQLVVETTEQGQIKSVHLEDVGMIILEHQQISLTHAVIQQCMSNNIVLINCDQKHMPQGIMLPHEGHVELSERHREQLEASTPLKKNLWAQTVQAKITNQDAVLRWRGCAIPKMAHLVREVNSGDGSNCEGQAAAIYWANLFDSFPSFLRGRYGEPPNHYLNYGYAILRAMMARALVSSGLILSLGIHHLNKYNAFCLADDMMEPFRPFVDVIVCHMADEGLISEDIKLEHKTRILSIATMDVMVDGRKSPLWNAVIRSAQSLQLSFKGSARKLLFPEYGLY
jgi:CRISPR-associated protein Cas1